MGLMYPVDRCIRFHMKGNCTGELEILGSTQVETVGGHNPLNKRPLELGHQSRTQLILAALKMHTVIANVETHINMVISRRVSAYTTRTK